MLGEAVPPESIMNIGEMLTNTYIQCPFSAAHILQAARALKNVHNTLGKTSNKVLYCILFRSDIGGKGCSSDIITISTDLVFFTQVKSLQITKHINFGRFINQT